MKVQLTGFATALLFGMLAIGCTSDSGTSRGTGGSSKTASDSSAAGGAGSGGGGSVGSSGGKITGGSSATGGSSTTSRPSDTGTAGNGGSCGNVAACGGDVVGTWEVKSSCLKTSGSFDISTLGVGCKTAEISGTLNVTGTFTATSDGKYTDKTVVTGSDTWKLVHSCLSISGTTTTCEGIAQVLSGTLSTYGYEDLQCADASDGGCTCQGKINQTGGMGQLYNDLSATGKYTASDNTITIDSLKYPYCVKGTEMTLTPQTTFQPLTGTVVLQKTSSGTGGSTGGRTGTGGAVGGAGTTSVGGRSGSGGVTTSGGKAGSSTAGGAGGSTVPPGTGSTGPCDIYAAGSTPCVAAYSMVRVISKSYTGPLFQIRAGSSSTNNTMSGGTTKDIMPGSDGFVDSTTVDTACGSGYCTVSVLYDQSGKKNDIVRATKGGAGNGPNTDKDDYESCANAAKGKVTAGGHSVYPLYMAAYEGYRSSLGVKGNGMPVGGAADQGIYMLADGTHYGTACCWDFGNVTPEPLKYADMNTIFFGTGFWGKGDGKGPWFLCDFEGGVWAGGSGASGTANPKNPSMAVPFALGIVKTNSGNYAIRAADVKSATDLTTAYDGKGPRTLNNAGGIDLGVGGDNSNNSWGTFYEGAITAGRPSEATDLAVLKNIQAVGYTK
jgi:non-reducing end alpha-L-arabinofuranosidase